MTRHLTGLEGVPVLDVRSSPTLANAAMHLALAADVYERAATSTPGEFDAGEAWQVLRGAVAEWRIALRASLPNGDGT